MQTDLSSPPRRGAGHAKIDDDELGPMISRTCRRAEEVARARSEVHRRATRAYRSAPSIRMGPEEKETTLETFVSVTSCDAGTSRAILEVRLLVDRLCQTVG